MLVFKKQCPVFPIFFCQPRANGETFCHFIGHLLHTWGLNHAKTTFIFQGTNFEMANPFGRDICSLDFQGIWLANFLPNFANSIPFLSRFVNKEPILWPKNEDGGIRVQNRTITSTNCPRIEELAFRTRNVQLTTIQSVANKQEWTNVLCILLSMTTTMMFCSTFFNMNQISHEHFQALCGPSWIH